MKFLTGSLFFRALLVTTTRWKREISRFKFITVEEFSDSFFFLFQIFQKFSDNFCRHALKSYLRPRDSIPKAGTKDVYGLNSSDTRGSNLTEIFVFFLGTSIKMSKDTSERWKTSSFFAYILCVGIDNWP